MVRIFDQTEIGAAWLCDNTEFMNLPLEETELFLSSLVLNLRSARLSGQQTTTIPAEVPGNENVKPEKAEKKGKKKVVVPPPDVDPVEMEKSCTGELSIAKDSPCQNGVCNGKTKKECAESIEKKIKEKEEEKQEKAPRKMDKFGFDVNSNTGKINTMLITGEFSKKEIIEKIGCAEGSLNVHFGNLRKKGFKLKENKEGKWKLTKTKIK